MQAFLDDRIELKPGERIERTRLLRMYEDYCRENRYIPLSSKSFYKNMRGKGYRDHKSDGYYYFNEICPKSALTGQEKADFKQATLEENAVFAENNAK